MNGVRPRRGWDRSQTVKGSIVAKNAHKTAASGTRPASKAVGGFLQAIAQAPMRCVRITMSIHPQIFSNGAFSPL